MRDFAKRRIQKRGSRERWASDGRVQKLLPGPTRSERRRADEEAVTEGAEEVELEES